MSRTLSFRVAILWALIVCLPLPGCIKLPSFKPSKKIINFYTLAYPSLPPVTTEPLGSVTMIRRMTTFSQYGTDRMVIQGSIFGIEFSYYQRWAASPSSMISDFLYRDLSDSGLFEAVLNGPGYVRPMYELSGTLEKIQANRDRKGWNTELVVNMLFFPYGRDGDAPLADRLYQKRYEITAPCKDSSAESIVASMSVCMQELSTQLIRDLKKYLLTQEAGPAEPTTTAR